MEYRRLQSMYAHMVGRAATVVSPFYFILLGLTLHEIIHYQVWTAWNIVLFMFTITLFNNKLRQ